MATGKVKWFNNAKGYGFILSDDAGEDLFAHFSSIQMDGYKTLKAGQAVKFDMTAGPKGMHAVNITAPDDDGSVAAAAPSADGDSSQWAEDTSDVEETESADDTLGNR